ncbi:MAG: class I SAM-dependent methyltransferase [bacterium]
MHGPAGDIFDQLALTYDRGNRVVSLGQDLRWKRRAVGMLSVHAGGVYVDVGAGTGDLAKRIVAAEPGALAIAIDASLPMLRAGHMPAGIDAAAGDAEDLPLVAACADGVVTGFLLRNLADLPAFFACAARVLKPGGRLVILEIAYPSGRLRRGFFKAYFHGVVPILGGLATGRRKAYAYLSRSLKTFPTPTSLAAIAAGAGFEPVELRHGAWTGMFLLTMRKA